MGIDIGDLSTVLLASVPRTVASYLQRVGRAGRLTGNSLDITFVAGRGRAAGLFDDPLDMLNGTVHAPGAYLSAEEILRSQFLASVMDTLAGDDRIDPPIRPAPGPRLRSEPGTYLGALLEEMRRRGTDRVDEFLDRFTTGDPRLGRTHRRCTHQPPRHGHSRRTGASSGLETAVHARSADLERRAVTNCADAAPRHPGQPREAAEAVPLHRRTCRRHAGTLRRGPC